MVDEANKMALINAALEFFQRKNGSTSKKKNFCYILKDYSEKKNYFTAPNLSHIISLRIFSKKGVNEFYQSAVKYLESEGQNPNDFLSGARVAEGGHTQKLKTQIPSGGWIFIQFRSSRAQVDQEVPSKDIRVAIMFVGPEKMPSKGQEIEIIGNRTTWRGYVDCDGDWHHHVIHARQVDIKRYPEEQMCLMLLPSREKTRVEMSGILLGAAHSQHDAYDPPIYSSVVLLVQIEECEINMNLPLSESDHETLRKYCGYHPWDVNYFRKEKSENLNDQIINAVNRFKERTNIDPNIGERIIVRR